MSSIPKPQKVRIVPLGGLEEIGMNCMAIETENEMILVDCGVMFSDLDHFGIEYVVPDFTYLRTHRQKLSAFVMTHGHEDHIGALPFLCKEFPEIPVYATPFTKLLIAEKFKDHGLEDKIKVHKYQPGSSFKLKEIVIETIPVTHSILDCVSLLITTPVGKILHTGDFKIDPKPYLGHEFAADRFIKAGDEGVLLLMSDSTNIEQTKGVVSEGEIFENLKVLLSSQKDGAIFVTLFASNVARVAQVLEIAKSLGKLVHLSGRGMNQYAELAFQAGYLKAEYKGLLLNEDQADATPRENLIVLVTGSQGEYRSSLVRISRNEHRILELDEGDVVVFSSRKIPGNEKKISKLVNAIFKNGAIAISDRGPTPIHASGHATRPELKQMLEMVRPKFFVPVHGEFSFLVKHGQLAHECGVAEENILITTNGNIVELTSNSIKLAQDFMEETKVHIEYPSLHTVSKEVLRERRNLAERGAVMVTFVKDKVRGRIVSEPEVLLKGTVPEALEAEFTKEVQDTASKAIRDYHKDLQKGHQKEDLKEKVRVEIRRYFDRKIGQKPIVYVMINEI